MLKKKNIRERNERLRKRESKRRRECVYVCKRERENE